MREPELYGSGGGSSVGRAGRPPPNIDICHMLRRRWLSRSTESGEKGEKSNKDFIEPTAIYFAAFIDPKRGDAMCYIWGIIF